MSSRRQGRLKVNREKTKGQGKKRSKDETQRLDCTPRLWWERKSRNREERWEKTVPTYRFNECMTAKICVQEGEEFEKKRNEPHGFEGSLGEDGRKMEKRRRGEENNLSV